MALLRWMGVGPFHQQQHQLLGQRKEDESPIKPISHPDAKRYGFENSGNTCYANSVLQALYFCSPFRELVCNTPDRSYLYPRPPIQYPLASASQTTASKSANHSKLAATPFKRGPGAGHPAPDPKADSSSAADVDGKGTNTGPPIPSHSPTLFSALRYLFLHIAHHSVDNGTIAPTAFIAKLRRENELFRNTQHQDAHEFLNYLLNKIVEELEQEDREDASRPSPAPSQNPQDELSKSVGSLASSATPSTSPTTTTNNGSGSGSSSGQPTSTSHATLVHSLFEGVLTSETRCLTCETVSSRDESFLDLSIDIEQNSSVTACLRQFSASEMLCQRNKFFCDACCGLQEAEKRMKIKHSPNILALHLKRFKYQEELQKYVKLSYRVAFPFELRLFNTVDDAVNPDRLYELFAIVVHIGSGPHHGHYITIIKAQGSWVVFDDDSVEAIKESEIPKYYGEGSSGAYVLFYQAVDMDREALGLPPNLPAPSAVEVVNEGAVVGGDAAAIVVDSASLPPDAPGVLPISRDGEEVIASPPASLPNGKGPATPLKLDLPPVPALNTSPMNSPVLVESVSKANTPGLSKGAAGFFQSLRHSASSKASMAKEKESKEKEVIPPLPSTPLLNGDLYTNGHAQATGVKEKESKEGGGVTVGGNIFRRSLKTKKREPAVSVHHALVEGSPAIPASPHLPSSVPPSPKHQRRPSGPQVQPAPTPTVDQTNNAVPPMLPLPVASLPLPTRRGSTLDDTNATASMSSSWTSASVSAPGPAGPGSGGPLAPVALPSLPFTPPMSLLAQESELPLPMLPPDRVPSPAGSSSGRIGTAMGTGIGNPTRSSHSKSNSSEFSPIPDLSSTQNSNNNNNNNSGQDQLAPPPGSVPGPRAPLASPRAFQFSLGGGEAKRPRAVARTGTEDAQAREREREKKALEEKTRKTREREEKEKRTRLEKEREEKDEEKEKEKEQQQHNNKPRASRKMSLSGMAVVGRLGASFGWNKDKDKHADKDKDKGTPGVPSLPPLVPRGSQHPPSNEAEQDLPPPERLPGYLAIGASPRFIF